MFFKFDSVLIWEMKDKIGIGFIGSGFARKTQIPAFAVCEHASMVSISSQRLENAKSTAEEFSIGHYSNNWRETVEHDDVDLVCITTPPDTHFEMTMHSLDLGKNVLCEKPMAMNTEQAEEMTKLAVEKGVLALIDHELRFTNGRQKAFQLLREGKIGKVVHAKYQFNNAFRGNKNLPWNWWSDIKSGGGALGAIGSHVIDSFQWFLDCKVIEIFCQLHTHVKHRPDTQTGEIREVTSDDQTMLILKFGPSDLVKDATATASLSVVEPGHYRNNIEFYGTKGAIKIEDGGEIFFADINENIWREIEFELGEVAPKMQGGGWSRGFFNFAKEIVTALAERKTEINHAATFEDGLQIQKVLDAARESNQNGCVVHIT